MKIKTWLCSIQIPKLEFTIQDICSMRNNSYCRGTKYKMQLNKEKYGGLQQKYLFNMNPD